MKELFAAYGDNVVIQRLETQGTTCKGRVIHCGHRSLPTGSIVLYGYSEWNEIEMTDICGSDGKPIKTVDVIWRPKIRCILIEVG